MPNHLAAPTLPIENRSIVSPTAGGRSAASSPGKVRPPSAASHRNHNKVRHWADYTPTWVEFTPTPWAGQEGLCDAAQRANFGVPMPGVYITGAGALEGERNEEPSRVWPATPTPSGGSTSTFGFGLSACERPDLLQSSSMANQLGIPMQPPADVAAMAAAAAAAAGAAKAAAAGCRRAEFSQCNGELGYGHIDRDKMCRPLSEAYGTAAGATPKKLTTSLSASPISDRMGSPSPHGELRSQAKNSMFVNPQDVVEEEDEEETNMVPKSTALLSLPSEHEPARIRPIGGPFADIGNVPSQPSTVSLQAGLAPPNLPSRGSQFHGTGKCRPCAWYWKPQKCQNKQDCGYCHLCPDGELKSRKKSKVAAMRMGALLPAKSGNTAGAARVLKLSPLL